MPNLSTIDTVRRFWELMASNDFFSVAAMLAEDFVLEWPQTKERIRGAQNFARMNQEYPAYGRWEFQVNRLFGNDSDVVSDVSISDGTQKARALSFFTVTNGKITQLVEFWADDYPAPANRAHLVEIIKDNG